MSKRVKLLELRHTEYDSHVETWSWDSGKQRVYVKSVCPMNYPPKSSVEFTLTEALRQFALLTSEREGWKVEVEYPDWHEVVELKYEECWCCYWRY